MGPLADAQSSEVTPTSAASAATHPSGAAPDPPLLMAAPRSCCKPCDARGFCSTDINCCIECHMSWEEAQCGLYLPPQTLALLRHQHQMLLARGLPAQALAEHSQWEEGVFRAYCPPELLAQVEADHDAWEHGRLRSRAAR